MLPEINSLLTPSEVIENSWKLKNAYIFATNKRLIIRGRILITGRRGGPIKVLRTQDVAYEHINSIEHEIVKPKTNYAVPLFIGAIFMLIFWVLSREIIPLLLSLCFFAIALYGLIYCVIGREHIVLHTAAGPFYIEARNSEGVFREVLYYVRLKKGDK
jgi:hypothetical protein